MIQNDQSVKKTVLLNEVCSAELHVRDEITERVLRDISLEVLMGEVVGIAAEETDEARLLLEIIASVRPYYSGKCILAEIGMMQKKRVILPFLFYIDTPNMLYDNMTVLEYIVFATMHSDILPKKRQRNILEDLIHFGMEPIAFKLISSIEDTDKIIVELIAASYSDSTLVVLNALDYVFSTEQIRTIEKICAIIRTRGSVVIGTTQAKFIGICCDKVAFIIDGKIEYFGLVSDLCKSWDKVLYLITDRKAEHVAELLREAYEAYTYVVSGDNVLVFNYSDDSISDEEFIKILFRQGVKPDNIKINKGRVENSFEELRRLNDL